ncbi:MULTISPECIES: ArsR/SmtB family transcription factor [Salinibaculum]|uniref:ArsR/SmtB family transcription factor n=1 Tax=Salinibaculum TaxID=2732368 RepID=UPI0030CB6EF9
MAADIPEHHVPGTPEAEQLDRVFRALAAPVRRELLRALSEREVDHADLSWLADRLTGVDDRLDTPEQVVVALTHVHLPMLADAGLVEYDRRSETVRYDPHPFVSRMLRTIPSIAEQ